MMVKIFQGTKEEYYMDENLSVNLDIAKDVITKDWDMIFAVDGAEGSGKSVLAQQAAFYCDPTLTNDRIVFTPFQFKKAILDAKKFQAVIYDEAYTGLSSRATMSLINRALVSMLAEIRQKNLFVFVVMPTFFDLDKYVAIWRSRALLHVYVGDNFQRGFFCFYNADRKKNLYINGKKYYSYAESAGKPNFRGRFTNRYTVDVDTYLLNKKNSLIAREKQAQEAEIKRQLNDALFDRLIEVDKKLEGKIPNYVKAEILGISEVHYYRKLKQYEAERGLS